MLRLSKQLAHRRGYQSNEASELLRQAQYDCFLLNLSFLPGGPGIQALL
jgi:hypothetical protein